MQPLFLTREKIGLGARASVTSEEAGKVNAEIVTRIH
jgi:hypothetical protein